MAKKTNLSSEKLLNVVGVGASAGGTRALKSILSSISSSDGIAVIVAQHLDESGKQLAIETLHGFIKRDVFELEDGISLEPGKVYLTPPHKLVDFVNGRVSLTDAVNTDQKLAVIDHLFNSLAKEFAQGVVGIVLSGEASDGAQGLRAINSAGGLSLCQSLESAEHPSMPKNAIATGAVDHVLDPSEMWSEVLSYTAYLKSMMSASSKLSLKDQLTSSLTSICDILHEKTRHDFKHYKTSTLLRRIQRRMQVLQILSADAYIEHLSKSAEEIDTLFKELLINVTSFFRDKESFEILRDEVLSELVREAKVKKKIRIWVAGCSTGEEAYSLAIMLRELTEGFERPPEMQIIATDIDDAALNIARRGSYSASIVEQVSPERLSKYFVKRAGKFHVTKELREMCLFSIHNLITDPPFSQLDLISCRNVLIYLGSHLQKKLFPVFHYALRPNGFLFLGTSETLTSHKELFKSVNTKHRIAQRKATAIKLPSINTSVQSYLSHFQENEKVTEADLSLISQRIALDEMPMRYAVVNDELQILSSSAGMNKYVQIPEGVFQNNILKLVQPGLRAPLRSTFNLAKKEKRKAINDSCTIKTDLGSERTCLIVQPMPQLGDLSELYWVAFQNMGTINPKEPSIARTTGEESDLLDHLERELSSVRQELDRSVQDLEASNEELKSSNEELLSMNEELQSANEELETSKEDVQNSNDALIRANLDLENLLASTQIATLFLDDEFRIRGFTPAIREIYNIQQVDIGRKLSDITTSAKGMPSYPQFSILNLGSAVEDQISLPGGKTFLRRLLPYKTDEHTREGVVVTFIDVTDMRRMEGRFITLANTVPVITWTAEPSGEVTFFNSRWYEYTGQKRVDSLDWGWTAAVHRDDLNHTKELWSQAIRSGEEYSVEYRLRRGDGTYRWHSGLGVATKNESGDVTGWFGTCFDIHDRKEMTNVLEQSGQSLRTIIETIPQHVWRTTPDGSADYVSEGFYQFIGVEKEQVLGWAWLDLIHPDDRARVSAQWVNSITNQNPISVEFRIFRKNNQYTWVISQGNPYFNSANELEAYYGTWTDIHERVSAQEARLESEKRFRVMADTAPVLIWVAGVDRMRTWFNRGWLEWTGRTMEQESGSGWSTGVHPDDFERCMALYNESFDERHEFNLEYRLLHNSGEYRWVHGKAVPRYSSSGEFEGFIGGCMDIHEQKRAAESIKSSETHFRTLVDNSPALMWITDKDARCTYLSKQWYETTGRTPEQDLEFGWVENVHPEDREAAGKAFFSAVESRGRISIRYRLRHKDGSYRWSIDSGMPLISADGGFLGYIGTVIDIHDQVSYEEELLSLNERFDRSAAATDLGVWYCDLPFDELIWNKEVKQHFFMAPDARVTIDDFYNHIHPEDREKTKAAISKSIETHGPYDILYRTIDLNNPASLNWIRAIGWTDYNEKDEPIRFDGITLNVTAERKREEELFEAKDTAERAKRVAEIASESKTRFLANMSHEIRTPLSAIVGYADLLRSHIGKDSEANSYIERIARNSTVLSRLIDELLDLSRIEADKLEIEILPVKLDVLVEDIFATMNLRAEFKGIALNFNWLSKRPDQIYTDPVRFTQILTNVIGNAVKFTERGSVDVSFEHSNSILKIQVKDTGIGLYPEQRQRIFEPFMQGDASVTRKFGGSGLGLALAKRLTKLLGGDLELESTDVGRGTCFRIEISTDAKDAKIDRKIKIQDLNQDRYADCTGKKILVVDDAPDNRVIVEAFLRVLNCILDQASNGEEAVKLAAANKYDLILMDIQMPHMDGYQALEKIKSLKIKTPVVALTAHAFNEERERCFAAGFNDYITKPIDRNILVQKVCDHLKGSVKPS